jgi:hypothetical protein
MIEVAIAIAAWLLLAVPAVAIVAGGRPDIEDDLDVDLSQPPNQ